MCYMFFADDVSYYERIHALFITTLCIGTSFLPRCIECRRGLAIRILSVCLSICLSVCLSVKRMICDKMKESCASIP